MKVKELVRILEELAPLSCACSWDNSGLVLGDPEAEVKHIFVGFDSDLETIRRAVEAGADFLLTHHPLLFKPVNNLCLDTLAGKKLSLLMGAGMAVYGMHTSFDAAPGCMAELAAARLGLLNPEILDEEGCGILGELSESLSSKQAAELVKRAFGLPLVKLWTRDTEKRVRRIAVLPGSGGSEWTVARNKGAELYITGDVSHHQALDAMDMGMTLLDAGHYGTEWYFTAALSAYLKEKLEAEKDLRITAIEKCFPEIYL